MSVTEYSKNHHGISRTNIPCFGKDTVWYKDWPTVASVKLLQLPTITTDLQPLHGTFHKGGTLIMNGSLSSATLWRINATVNGKTMTINVGDGTQRVKWLAHVAIAKWDEENGQGWQLLGIPTSVLQGKRDIDMGSVIRNVLQDGDDITIFSSLLPSKDT